GRWQLWQFFCRIGATSLVNVGALIFPICAKRHAAEPTANSKVRTVRFMRIRLCGLWNMLLESLLFAIQHHLVEGVGQRLAMGVGAWFISTGLDSGLREL